MTTAVSGRPARARHRRSWPVPVALVLLSTIPLVAGALLLVQQAGGPALVPADDRFDSFPVALGLHVAGSAVFALVGCFQFVPRLRRRHLTWHRRAGRALVVAGMLVCGSAVWITLTYHAQPGTGPVLFWVRLVVGPTMAAFLFLGFSAVRRRDIAAHRAWMVRAYALGLGAGTQVFTEGFGEALFGRGVLVGDLLKAVAWVINLLVAEWVIRRGGRP
ncbi:MAG: DUF2306 domain-containing protein [Nocardioidaceae bacterium]